MGTSERRQWQLKGIFVELQALFAQGKSRHCQLPKQGPNHTLIWSAVRIFERCGLHRRQDHHKHSQHHQSGTWHAKHVVARSLQSTIHWRWRGCRQHPKSVWGSAPLICRVWQLRFNSRTTRHGVEKVQMLFTSLMYPKTFVEAFAIGVCNSPSHFEVFVSSNVALSTGSYVSVRIPFLRDENPFVTSRV